MGWDLKKVTPVQARAMRALDSRSPAYDPSHRPRGSLERLAKKGLVGGNRKSGWYLTADGEAYLRTHVGL
jgi:hypothetical protein